MDRKDEWFTLSEATLSCFLHPPSQLANQRKMLLTNSQKKILIINLYTDKQDRSQQGDHPSQVSKLRQNQK